MNDTTSFESVRQTVGDIVEKEGLHVLLNNAGMLTRQRYNAFIMVNLDKYYGFFFVSVILFNYKSSNF